MIIRFMGLEFAYDYNISTDTLVISRELTKELSTTVINGVTWFSKNQNVKVEISQCYRFLEEVSCRDLAYKIAEFFDVAFIVAFTVLKAGLPDVEPPKLVEGVLSLEDARKRYNKDS